MLRLFSKAILANYYGEIYFMAHIASKTYIILQGSFLPLTSYSGFFFFLSLAGSLVFTYFDDAWVFFISQ